MADRRLFTGLNNYSTTVAATVSVGSTSITIAVAGTLPSPVAGEYFNLTLSGVTGNTPEIVRVTSRTGAVLTVVRAQDGTTAQGWAIGALAEAYITAGDLAQFGQGVLNTGDAKGIDALDLQSARAVSTQVASGDESLAVGYRNTASGVQAVAVGRTNTASDTDALAAGSTNTASAQAATALGNNCLASGINALAVGSDADATALDATALGGAGARATAEKATAIGGGNASAVRAIAIGAGAVCAFAQMENIAATNVVRNGATAFTGDELYAFAGRDNILFGPNISLTQTAANDLLVITIPTGVRFYADEIGLLVVASTAVTVNPAVSFGVSGDSVALIAQTTITAVAALARTRFTSPVIISGLTTLTFSLKVAATATTLTARPYFKGFAVAT